MSKIAEAVQTLEPARIGRPRKIDLVLDADDKAAVIERYRAGCSARTIRRALRAAGVDISENPIIDLLRDAGVYRSG